MRVRARVRIRVRAVQGIPMTSRKVNGKPAICQGAASWLLSRRSSSSIHRPLNSMTR